jgi:ABC-2 type transport system ATP-binding protein
MIEIVGLTKKYGDRTAVSDLNLSIQQGELFGLLGPNGAGKTTTIKVLTMLTQPTAGHIVINGCRLPKDERRIKAMIGVVSQHLNLDIELTARENLELHGRLHQIPFEARKQRSEELLQFVELWERGDDMVQTFSGGMKRRLMIARALFHRPQILFLDEPTAGLDPQVRRRLWEVIRRLASEGLTVLLTTHYIEEAENLCDRVAILHHGKLIALDSPSSLCQGLGEYVVEWRDGENSNNRFFADRLAAAQFVGTLTAEAAIRRSSLEDVFVELTGRKVAEG